MDAFLENIKNPDPQIQEETLENMSELLNNYEETEQIFSYTSEEQINSFFKTDLLRFINSLISVLTSNFNDLAIKDGIKLLLNSFASILNKNIFSICISFSTLISALKKLNDFDESYLYDILPIDTIMNLTESFNNEPTIELLDFILLISFCVDSEESEIDVKILFSDISDATASLFTDINFNKVDSAIITRVFTNIIRITIDFSNSENDFEVIPETFYMSFFNTLIKVLQCDSFEKQKFAIKCLEDILVDNSFIFFKWANQVNPYITLNNIEGIDQIVIEISHLIQKIAGCQIIEIDQETLENLLLRIDNSDMSQKTTFTNNFGVIASNSDEETVLKVIKNYIDSHNLTPELCTFLGSCAVRTLTAQPNVSSFIVSFLESKIPELFGASNSNIITVLENVYSFSSNDRSRMLMSCLSHFTKQDEKVPKYVYVLLLAILPSLKPVEASSLFNYMVNYDDRDEPLFGQLLGQIVMNCQIPLEKNHAYYVLKEMTESEEKLDILFEVMKKKGTNIIEIPHWISQITTIILSKPIKIALKFTNKVMPHFYYLNYEVYSQFFVDVFISLVKRYVYEENETNREQIFECFYVHHIMVNCTLRTKFLEGFLKYFYSIYNNQPDFIFLARAVDFIRNTIIRTEYYINAEDFMIERHRPIKKEKGGFDLALLHIKPGLIIHVYPNTKVRDLLFTASLYANYASIYEIGLRKFNDQAALDNDSTLAENDINESTELEIAHLYPEFTGVNCQFIYSYYISYHLYKHFYIVISTMFSQRISFDETDASFSIFVKSMWKLLKILPTVQEFKNQMTNTDFILNALFQSDNEFKQLYIIQEITNKANNDPNYLSFLYTNNLLKSIADFLINKDTKEKIRVETLQILICYSTNFQSFDYFDDNSLNSIIPFLTDYFISTKKAKTQNLILEMLNLIFSSNIDNKLKEQFAHLLIENNTFFNICVFSKESLITHSLELFSILARYSSTVIFNKFASYFDQVISENNSLVVNGDYFSLFSEILSSTTSECDDEIERIFQKCVEILHNFNFKWYDSVAELVSSFIKHKNKTLEDETIVELINFVFDGNGNVKHPSIFSILTLVFESAESDESFYFFYVQDYIEKFKTDSWNYSPSIHKKFENYCGLRNLGSTCYMNSILQLLENNNDFFNRVFANKEPSPIIVQIRELFANLECSIRGYVNTESFSNHWKEHEYPPFDPRIQEDAAEFLHIFLDKLPDENKEPFSGNLVNSFNGITVDFHHDIFERFYTLEIPILSDFFQSMQSIIKPQLFTGNNQYMSDEKGKIDAKRTTKIIQFPRTLVIQLKRFDFNVREGKRTKINSEFAFPMSFNTKECFPNIDDDQEFNYVLTGVITHSGTADGGHYNAIKRNFDTSNIDNDDEWICFNDSEVTRMNKEQFLLATKGGATSKVTAYLLFYEWNDSEFRKQLNEDKKLKIDKEIQQKIANENQKMHQIQSLFNDPMARFILSINNPAIQVKYYTHVMIHSDLLNLTKLFTNSITKQVNENANLIAEQINEEYLEIFDSLINATNEITASITAVISYIYRFDQSQQSANMSEKFDVNKMVNISSNIVSYLKNYVSSWRIYERFGKIVEVITSNYIQIALQYDYFSTIIDLITEFYNVTTGNVALENINLASFINSLNILIDSITSQEVLDKTAKLIEVHGQKIILYQPSFQIFIKNGILKGKIPAKFRSMINETLSMEAVVSSAIQCKNNREFIEILPMINEAGTLIEFFTILSHQGKYVFNQKAVEFPLLFVLSLFFSITSPLNQSKIYTNILMFLDKEIIAAEKVNPYFASSKNNSNQFASEIQEGLSLMFKLFGYTEYLHNTNPKILEYLLNVVSMTGLLNTPKDEHLTWFDQLFDIYFKGSYYDCAMDLALGLHKNASTNAKIRFLEPRFNTIINNVLNNPLYIEFTCCFYGKYIDVFKVKPNIFSILIQPGKNFSSFMYTMKAPIKSEYKDLFFKAIKEIFPNYIDSSEKEAPLNVLRVYRSAIDIVFNDPKLFTCVEKLADFMDDSSITLFLERLFQFSASIVNKNRIHSTLNIMTKVVQKINVLGNIEKLLRLAPNFVEFFRAREDQIPIVINFASLLCEKCHPIGDILFDRLIDISETPHGLNLTKWQIYAIALKLCHDTNRIIIIMDKIIEDVAKSNNLFDDKDVIECICILNEFVNKDDNQKQRCVIDALPEDKLEQLAESCVRIMSNYDNISTFMRYMRALIMLKNLDKFDIKSFVEKHKDLFMNQWPEDAEEYRLSFINL